MSRRKRSAWRAVARADDGDAHRLLLKQRHALGAFEQLFQAGLGKVTASSPVRRRR
jgi:hypothetical protein